MPVYNGLPWLHAAVESMLSQTFDDFEMLLVDDGSTDGSGEVCDTYAKQDARVRVLRHDGGVNRGLVASLNLGLAEARGEYVARMDADDLSYPERLARQVAFLDAHPDIGAVSSRVDSFDGKEWSVWGDFTDPVLIRWHLLFTTPVVHPMVTMRTRIAKDLEYEAAFERSEDYDFFWRFSRVSKIANLPEKLGYYRRDNEASISRTSRDSQLASYHRLQQRAQAAYGVTDPLPWRVSVFLMTVSCEETDAAAGPLGEADLLALGQRLGRLRTAFVRQERPDRQARTLIDAYIRWRISQFAFYLLSHGRVTKRRFHALRMIADPRGVIYSLRARAAGMVLRLPMAAKSALQTALTRHS